MNKKKGFKRILVILLLTIIIGAALVVLDFQQKVNTPFQQYKDSVIIQVKPGDSVASVGQLLYQQKVIPSYNYFRVYYRLHYKGASFKIGEYQFDQPMTMDQVIRKIIKGQVILYKVTIREGLMMSETAELLEQERNINYQEFMKLSANPSLIQSIDPQAPDLEGYLFPDTYYIRKDTDAKEMVNMMSQKFKDNFTNAMKWQADKLGLSIREVITMASLIEKETASRDERFLISSVFHNRLKLGMPMGCDPTVIYALKRDNVYRGKLGWKELKYDSPYNTRLYKGLPPGPICSPGYASIEAALYPDNTKYLYFVAKNSSSHYFSKSLAEHNRAVQKYIINKKSD